MNVEKPMPSWALLVGLVIGFVLAIVVGLVLS